jgi:hypothetical protein
LLGVALSLPIQKLAIKTASMPIQKFTANCVIADLEIGSQKLYLCRFRNRHQDCVAANSEIGGQKLFCCQFRNWRHNCVAVDLEIGSQLCRCW